MDFGYKHVRCVKCGVSTGNSLGIDDAVTRWNQRVADSRIAQLHSEIYHMKNRIAELDEELAIKQSIINRQVAIMGELAPESEHDKYSQEIPTHHPAGMLDEERVQRLYILGRRLYCSPSLRMGYRSDYRS